MSPRIIPTPRPRLRPTAPRRNPAPRRWIRALLMCLSALVVVTLLMTVMFETAVVTAIDTVLAAFQSLGH